MRYTIITPTILRPTLKRTCESIDKQSNGDWQHIVIVDLPPEDYIQKLNMLEALDSERRQFIFCDRRHNDFGHTCRRNAFTMADGDYLLYLDDDDYLADDNVLEELEDVDAPWAVFAVLRHGENWFHLPPRTNHTGTGMFIVRRNIGLWPNKRDYAADGLFVDSLRMLWPYQVIDSRPLTVIPESLYGL